MWKQYGVILATPSSRWFCAAVWANLAGVTFRTVTLTVRSFTSTGSAWGIAVTLALLIAPGVLIGPVMGAIGDRTDRKRFLATAYLASAVLIGSLFYPLGALHMPLVAFGLGICNTAINPAQIAAVSRVIPDALIPSAVALSATGTHVLRIVIPAVAALIMIWLPSMVFVANALLFLVAAAAITRVSLAHDPEPVPRGGPGVGFRLLLGLPALRAVVVLFVFLAAAIDLPTLNTAIYLERVLNLSATGLGTLLSAVGVGSVVGALAAGRGFVIGPRLVLATGAILTGLALIPVATRPGWWGLATLWFVSGFGCALVDAATGLYMVRSVSAGVRGRVVSALNALVTLAMVGWYLTIGTLTDRFGVIRVFWIGGLAAVLTATLVLARFWPALGGEENQAGAR